MGKILSIALKTKFHSKYCGLLRVMKEKVDLLSGEDVEFLKLQAPEKCPLKKEIKMVE